MSTNISKKKRDDLLDKIKQIRAFIAAAPQDENTGNLLSYLSELEKDVNGKKYGLVFEEHREEIDEVLDTHTPVLTEDADLFIDHGGQMNFLLEGDNLAALKLLEKTHRGKIDLIYIDPPYNRGKTDFVYDDDFVVNEDTFRHSKWISFMKSRLEAAKRLLTEAGLLVKLRDNMDETFEIQTIGRIRRMPEAKHYGSDLLDSCYLYTFDEKFTAGVKMALDKGALNACTLFLKSEYKDITLTGEQRSMISQPRNSQKALRAIWLYAEKSLGVGADKEENRIRLQAAGYILRDDVVRHTVSGETATLDFSSSDMNTISVTEKLNTHKHGRDYHQKIGKIGLEIGMEYSFMNTIIRKLFDKNFNYAHKILALEPREVYAFVLNNADRLRHLVREAMAAEMAQMQLDVQTKSLFEFHIPQSCLFTYNGEAKTQIIYKKNVYQNYLSSAAPRSTPEVKFEKFCEHSGNVEWWYKNGDKGSEYFSIVYGDNSEKQKLFYPDYIVGISGEIWIIETKGGFDRSGNSQDIDIYTPKKFEALKAYLDAHGLKGGIVRNDATTDELCICMEHYSDDIGSDDWVLLENILG